MATNPLALAQFLQGQAQQQGQSNNPEQPQSLQDMVQSGVADETAPSQKLFIGKPKTEDAPESMSDSLLRSFVQPQAQQIPAFKDDTSPARSLLSNMFLGMSAGLTGQKFQTIQQQKYQRYLDQVKVQLEQQQRNNTLAVGQMRVLQQALKQQSVDQYHNDLNKIRSTKDAAQQAYLQQQFQAKYGTGGLSWQQLDLANRKYEAMQRHLNNQDQLAEDKQGPIAQALKDPVYARNMAMLEQQFQSQGLDPNDPKVQPTFLAQLENATLVEHQKLAAMKGQNEQKPIPMFVPLPGGKGFQRVDVPPGGVLPQGAIDKSGISSLDTPTQITRSMIESAPKVLDLVNKQLASLDALEKKFGPIEGRKSDFLQGKIGLPGYGIAKYRTNGGLIETALMKMHLGARGGEQMMEHFHNMIGGMNQDPSNSRESLEAIKDYAQSVINEGKQYGMNVPDLSQPSGAPKVGTVEGGYRFKGGDPSNPLSWEKVK